MSARVTLLCALHPLCGLVETYPHFHMILGKAGDRQDIAQFLHSLKENRALNISLYIAHIC